MRLSYWSYPSITPEEVVLDAVTGVATGARVKVGAGVRFSKGDDPGWMHVSTGRQSDGHMAGLTL